MTMNDTNMNEAKIGSNNHAEKVLLKEQKNSEEISSEKPSNEKPSDLVVGTAWFIAFLFFMTAWMYFTA
jgi:ATP-dependent Zn protease